MGKGKKKKDKKKKKQQVEEAAAAAAEEQQAEKKSSKKKDKKAKSDEVIQLTHAKAENDKDYNAATGSKFAPGTSKQIALDVILKAIAKDKSVKDIRKDLADYRRENGKDRNLDAGYFSFVVASHPDHFEVRGDGTVKLVKEFTPDPSAVEKLKAKEKDRQERKKERKGEKKVKGGKGKKNKPVLKKD